ncbi:hypothetical protein RAA17_06080 [Komagataeibacter rhaeticus]|nr:hypothetical protein [Komagataeibacter rhaeticus]
MVLLHLVKAIFALPQDHSVSRPAQDKGSRYGAAALSGTHGRLPQPVQIPVFTHVTFDKTAPDYLSVCFLCVSCGGFRAQKATRWGGFLLSYQTDEFGCGGRVASQLAAIAS